jgi:hypothetical protein
MRNLKTFKLFESKKDTEDIIKNTLSKLPDGFYYRVKYGSRGSNDRNISMAIGEYGEITITIAKLNDENGKIWSVDKKEISSRKHNTFKFIDIKSNIDELLKELSDYRLVNGDYTGYISNNYRRVGNDDSDEFINSDFIRITFTIRSNNLPSFRNTKSDNDNDIKDIFLDVFDYWGPEINIKESGDFIKIMSIQNTSPYNIPIMDDSRRKEFINAIFRTESALDCNLLTVNLEYRDYTKLSGNRSLFGYEVSGDNFSIKSRAFSSNDSLKNKELSIEFIKNNEIISFTIIFKKN